MRGLVTDGNSAEMKKKKKNGTEPKEDRFENWSDKGRVSSVVGHEDWLIHSPVLLEIKIWMVKMWIDELWWCLKGRNWNWLYYINLIPTLDATPLLGWVSSQTDCDLMTSGKLLYSTTEFGWPRLQTDHHHLATVPHDVRSYLPKHSTLPHPLKLNTGIPPLLTWSSISSWLRQLDDQVQVKGNHLKPFKENSNLNSDST